MDILITRTHLTHFSGFSSPDVRRWQPTTSVMGVLFTLYFKQQTNLKTLANNNYISQTNLGLSFS